MHIFKIKGIVLQIQKSGKEENILTVFSEEYGKIKVQKKAKTKEKPLDIGYVFSSEIIQKEKQAIHTIRNIKVKEIFDYHDKSYESISLYLEFIWSILKHSPDWVQIKEIYKVGELINSIHDISTQELILWRLKILNIFWLLPDTCEENPIIQKILKFIHGNKFEKILKLQKLDNELLEVLQNFS